MGDEGVIPNANRKDPALLERIIRWMETKLPDMSERKITGEAAFHEYVQDGTKLCELANACIPRAVPRINRHKLLMFQLENHTNFQAALIKLGFKQEELYSPNDVHDYKDMFLITQNLRRFMEICEREGDLLQARFDGSRKATPSAARTRSPTSVAPSSQPQPSPVSPREASSTSSTALPGRQRPASMMVRGSRGFGGGDPRSVGRSDVSEELSRAAAGGVPASSSTSVASGIPSRMSTQSVASIEASSDYHDMASKEEFKYNPELERIAIEWMEKVLGEKPPAGADFQEQLRDGVYLCKLINALVPNSVKKINMTTIAFRQIENISSYLAACSAALGLRQSDLFLTSDLFEGKKMTAVVNHIFVLARTARKVNAQIPEIGDGSRTKSLWEQSLTGATMDDVFGAVEAQPCPEMTASQRELVDWVNATLSGSSAAATLLADSGSQIRFRPLQIDNLTSSLRTCLPLIRLIELLAGQDFPFPVHASPSTLAQSIENAKALIRFLTYMGQDADLSLEGLAVTQPIDSLVSARDVVTGNASAAEIILKYLRERYDMDYLFAQMILGEGGNAEEVAEAAELLAADAKAADESKKARKLSKKKASPPVDDATTPHAPSSTPMKRRTTTSTQAAAPSQKSQEREKEKEAKEKEKDKEGGGKEKSEKKKKEEKKDKKRGDTLKREPRNAEVNGLIADERRRRRMERDRSKTVSLPSGTLAMAENEGVKKKAGGDGSGNSPMDSQRVEKARQAVRKRVAEELLSTEKTYVRSLADAAMRVVAPLKQGNSPISKDEFEALFLNFEAILHVHQRFLSYLAKRLADFGPETPIGDLLLSEMSLLDLYDTYMRDYSGSLALLQYLLPRRPGLKALKEAFEKQNEQGTQLPLEAHLIMPVQRAPRYLLLVKELVKYTPKGNADHEALVRTQAHLQEKLADINENISHVHGHGMSKILELLACTDGAESLGLIKRGRNFVREGPLKLRVLKGSNAQGRSFRALQKQYHFVLFNDLLLVLLRKSASAEEAAAAKSAEFELIDSLPLSDVAAAASGAPDGGATPGTPSAVAEANPYSARAAAPELSFHLRTKADSVWVCIANSPEERNDWLSAVSASL